MVKFLFKAGLLALLFLFSCTYNKKLEFKFVIYHYSPGLKPLNLDQIKFEGEERVWENHKIIIDKKYISNLKYFEEKFKLFIETMQNFGIEYEESKKFFIIDMNKIPENCFIYSINNKYRLILISEKVNDSFINSIGTELHEQMHEFITSSDDVRWFKEGLCNIPKYEFYKRLKIISSYHFDKVISDWVELSKKDYYSAFKWKTNSLKAIKKKDIKEYKNYSVSSYIIFRLYLYNKDKIIKIGKETKKLKRISRNYIIRRIKKELDINLNSYEDFIIKTNDDFLNYLNDLKNKADNDLKEKIKILIEKEEQNYNQIISKIVNTFFFKKDKL